MRFWLSRNSSVSLREQLATQIMLGVVSEDLKPGKHLPSVREMARLHSIHFNTVSAAYHDLVKRGWLDTRKGSGVYVRRLPPSPPQKGHALLDDLIARLLSDASARGIPAGEVRARLQTWLNLQTRERLVVAEPEPELGAILVAEVREATGIPVTQIVPRPRMPAALFDGAAVAALTSRARQFLQMLPADVPAILLRLRSVPAALEGHQRPGPDAMVTVVSHSPEVLRWTRTILVAAAIDPDALNIRDAREPGWRETLPLSAMIIADVVTAQQIPTTCPVLTLRVIAESSFDELRQSFHRA